MKWNEMKWKIHKQHIGIGKNKQKERREFKGRYEKQVYSSAHSEIPQNTSLTGKKSLLCYMFIDYILILWYYLNNTVNLCIMNKNDRICLVNTSVCF